MIFAHAVSGGIVGDAEASDVGCGVAAASDGISPVSFAGGVGSAFGSIEAAAEAEASGAAVEPGAPDGAGDAEASGAADEVAGPPAEGVGAVVFDPHAARTSAARTRGEQDEATHA